MREYETVEALLTDSILDEVAPSRFPVRFILTDGFEAWDELISRLRARVDEVIELSSLCVEEDTFPYLGDLCGTVKSSLARSIMLLPLGEVLRYLGDPNQILRRLYVLEDIGRKRVYVPLFGMADLFMQNMRTLDRFQSSEGAEVWCVSGHDDVKITVVPFRVEKSEYSVIHGIRNYLRKWESAGERRLLLVSRKVPGSMKCSGSVDVKVYGSTFEYVKEFTPSFRDDSEAWGNPDQWQWLAERIQDGESVDQFAARRLNAIKFDPHQLYARWQHLDESQRWLLWLWTRMAASPQDYLGYTAGQSQNMQQLIENLINAVFTCDFSIETLLTRKTMLKHFQLTGMPTSFWERFSKLVDPLKRLQALSGLSEREHEEAVSAVGQLLRAGKGCDIWLPYLELVYPELAWYLTSFPYADDLAKRYFGLYVTSRVADRPNEKLLEIAGRIADEKTIWTYQSRGSQLEEFWAAGVRVIWVDALGVEWAGLLCQLLRQDGYRADCHLARASLPTTTGFNRGWAAEAQIDRELDKIAHSYDYRFPQSFVRELTYVAGLLGSVTEALNVCSQVIITSDHGLTRFAATGEKIEPPNGTRVHKWGRYAKLEPDQEGADISGPRWIVDDGIAVLGTHCLFEGGARQGGEVHGGATLEECLVPVIVVSRETVTQPLKLKLANPVVKVNAKGEGILVAETDQLVTGLTLLVAGQDCPGTSTDGRRWSFTLRGLRIGKHRGKIETGRTAPADIEFEVRKGLAEQDLGL